MGQNDETTRFEPGRAPASASPGDPHPTAEYSSHESGTGWPGRPDPDVDDAGSPAAAPAQGPIVVRTGGGVLRGLFFLTATAALVVAIVLGMTAAGILPHLKNPFGGRSTDRSQPALLKSIQDMNRFVAAEGNFQVIVDVQNDQKYVPDFLLNDRTLFVAAGTVDAYVDLSAIGAGAITESPDHKTVEIKLPAPQLNKPSINHDKSYVFAQQRGMLNRLGEVFASDPNRLQRLYQLGEQKIAEAAKSSELQQRAEDNTRRMLEGMLRSLGYTSIKINYAAP
ncbi:DUF4230 domain-containing protein [Planosporangium flavigriseum]|uniref:DUF4230 domain-containing protein n=1 Tax=Planosporangium flavigriseum TaxID=373681 RepID=A0A8J3LMF6_9ACTN|nr:DUF4230 domain-containing protein [Planosporangium flavigriseum]NJC66864.1 DUF4230 domain-containing protein [Planosporangium flavigriseum]GIG74392.1 hypothetical protein Pfl04_27960 [Planosporangium flavigriseum]